MEVKNTEEIVKDTKEKSVENVTGVYVSCSELGPFGQVWIKSSPYIRHTLMINDHSFSSCCISITRKSVGEKLQLVSSLNLHKYLWCFSTHSTEDSKVEDLQLNKRATVIVGEEIYGDAVFVYRPRYSDPNKLSRDESMTVTEFAAMFEDLMSHYKAKNPSVTSVPTTKKGDVLTKAILSVPRDNESESFENVTIFTSDKRHLVQMLNAHDYHLPAGWNAENPKYNPILVTCKPDIIDFLHHEAIFLTGDQIVGWQRPIDICDETKCKHNTEKSNDKSKYVSDINTLATKIFGRPIHGSIMFQIKGSRAFRDLSEELLLQIEDAMPRYYELKLLTHKEKRKIYHIMFDDGIFVNYYTCNDSADFLDNMVEHNKDHFIETLFSSHCITENVRYIYHSIEKKIHPEILALFELAETRRNDPYKHSEAY